jgi:hypothetical protein
MPTEIAGNLLAKIGRSPGAMGTGIGAAFGQALGSPGASIRNLLDVVTGGGGDDESVSPWMRALPGLLAVLGGGATAAMGGGIPMAMLAAAGLGGMSQAAGQSLDNPSFDPISGQELAKRTLGSDPGSLGGMGIEMALDPTTYLGGFGGKALPGALEARAAESAAARNGVARASQLEAHALEATAAPASKAVGTIEQAAAHTPGGGQRNSWDIFMDESNAASKAGYKPEVTAASPDFLGVDPKKVGKVYKQVNPAIRDDLSLLGYTNPGAGKSGSLNAGQIPDWANSRGGWLMPSKERAGPKLDHAAGYEGLMAQKVGPSPALNLGAEDLMSQSQKFDRMRADVPGLGGSNGYVPTAQATRDPIEEWLKQMAESKIRGRY